MQLGKILAATTQICSGNNVKANALMCRSVISRAAAAGAKLICLPEASDFIVNSSEVAKYLEPLEASSFVNEIQEEAKQSKVWVSVGVHEKPDSALDPDKESNSSRGFNTQVLIDDQGTIVERYRKLHLFDVDIKGGLTILESNTTIPGTEEPPIRNTPVGKVGLLTCYDMRFPEISLQLRHRGAEIITYPSAFTMKTGAAHWYLILRARAVETQSYVIAAAQVGQHSSTRESYGHALIVDPWGTVLAECPDKHVTSSDPHSSTFALAEIDMEWLIQIRRNMPLWDQRRNDIYPMI